MKFLLTSPVISSIRLSTALSNSSVKSLKASSIPGTASKIISQALVYFAGMTLKYGHRENYFENR